MFASSIINPGDRCRWQKDIISPHLSMLLHILHQLHQPRKIIRFRLCMQTSVTRRGSAYQAYVMLPLQTGRLSADMCAGMEHANSHKSQRKSKHRGNTPPKDVAKPFTI